MVRNSSILLALLVALVAAGARAKTAPDEYTSFLKDSDQQADLFKDWELEITPYAWVPDVHAKVDTPRLGQQHFNMSIGDVLQNLDIGAMGRITGRWHRWVGVLDGLWTVLGDNETITNGPLRFDADAEMTMAFVQALGGYRLIRRAGGLIGDPQRGEKREFGFDALVGVNYTYLETEFEPKLLTPQNSFERHFETSTDWVSPTIGLRIHNDFTSRFRLETLASVGGFGVKDAPEISWLITTLLSYRFTDGWQVSLGHRAIITNDDTQLHMHGPILGIGYRF